MKQIRFLAWLLFSPRGRIGRAQWWLGGAIQLILAAPSIILFMFDELYGRYLTHLTMFDLAMMYPAYAVDAKRFHDRGRTGLWALFGAAVSLMMIGNEWLTMSGAYEEADLFYIAVGAGVAIVIWFVIDLGCARGVSGPNRHGLDPRTVPFFGINVP